VSIKNDGHYFCRAGGNRPDGLNEPVTKYRDSPLYYRTAREALRLEQSSGYDRAMQVWAKANVGLIFV
ncbi:hypothetical protein U4Z70_25300, partial [Escherichia coli]|nr:hypothetical protein [Escherichia coli]